MYLAQGIHQIYGVYRYTMCIYTVMVNLETHDAATHTDTVSEVHRTSRTRWTASDSVVGSCTKLSSKGSEAALKAGNKQNVCNKGLLESKAVLLEGRVSPNCIRTPYMTRVGQNHTFYTYIRCTYGIFSREITIHTVIYGMNIRFWPTLYMTVYLDRKISAKDAIYTSLGLARTRTI